MPLDIARERNHQQLVKMLTPQEDHSSFVGVSLPKRRTGGSSRRHSRGQLVSWRRCWPPASPLPSAVPGSTCRPRMGRGILPCTGQHGGDTWRRRGDP